MTGNLTVQRALESIGGKTSFKTPKTPRSRRNIKLSGNLAKLLLDHKAQQELESALAIPSADDTPLNGRNVVNRHI
jgi:hypothetical protein